MGRDLEEILRGLNDSGLGLCALTVRPRPSQLVFGTMLRLIDTTAIDRRLQLVEAFTDRLRR